MRVIGLMSGTSADGIDAALIVLDGATDALRWRFVAHAHIDYHKKLRAQILAACNPATSSVDHLCRLNFALGEAFAQAAQQVAQDAGLALDQIDLIGSHGQTVWHDVDSSGRVTATLQIGEAAVIADRTGVPTVADFRVADVAAGGQGAPLVPFADYILFRHPDKYRAVQNIGGIANVTLLPPHCAPSDVSAFDSGPGNMVMDALVERMTDGRETFDRDGRIAASGHVDGAWLEELLDHPYFQRTPPKTTGREMFGAPYANRLWDDGLARGLAPQDIVATATALTAETIVSALLPLPVGEGWGEGELHELILGGGGADNTTLVRMIAARLPHAHGAKILRHEDFGIPSQAKEAMAFAILAYAAFHHEPNNLPSVTGARRAVVMGKITNP
ncbi:MAG: anhydro-N-acetylmuramic acid kinase [Chloroflexota bacterium]